MHVNVVAIDDHEVALLGLEQMLRASGECTLVGTYHSVPRALAHMRAPDAPTVHVALLDLRLADGSDPLINAEALHGAGMTVLVYSSLESPFLLRRALQAGVAGAVEKTASRENLIHAITLAAQGKTYATADWAGAIDSDPLLHAADLSPRQREVLELYAMGESAKGVASITGLSQDTVQDYLGRIRTKYSMVGRPANTKIDLLIRAQEDGYLPGPSDIVGA
ncbi:response regulator transcription factor [Corynebacterium sp. YIM 101645]|uniref:Response regulator transcription factor n=1 Tax=Corynebacterium lemuris TaxID=1859292 RepID=A0ABT2FW83_9CORY|nr:response regulator transcription factor [Corynebacterium lemuris]MCS5479498.1 response regulator transcription factor [Corynebacterium lemuris]